MTRIEADVAIVGGGLVGCMTACALRRRGRSLVVLERGLVGGQSSGVSFGSLRLQGQQATDLPLALRAHERWLAIEAELGESLELEQHGHVHLALNHEQVERLAANAAELRGLGLEPELLDRAEARRRWPFLGEAVLGASWSRHDATVNPRLVTPAFARAALRRGAVIKENTEVVGAEHFNGRFELRARSPGGESLVVVAESLVNAAGAWCGALAQKFGETIPVFAAGPAEIVTEPLPRFAWPVMHVVDGSVLFRQTARGNVVIGGHPRMSVDAESRQVRVPPEKIATNLARLIAIVPQMRAQHVIRSWSGIEGYLADMRPVLGPSATTPRLFHACAFSGHGLQVGPAVAEVLAELIVDGATDTPIAAYDIGRFEAGAGQPKHALAEEFQEGVVSAPPPDTRRPPSAGTFAMKLRRTCRPPICGPTSAHTARRNEMKLQKFSIDDARLERSPGQAADVFVGNLIDERHGGPITIGYGRYAPGQSLAETMAVNDVMIVLAGRLSVSTDAGTVTAGPGEIVYMPKGEAVAIRSHEEGALTAYVTYPHWRSAHT